MIFLSEVLYDVHDFSLEVLCDVHVPEVRR